MQKNGLAETPAKEISKLDGGEPGMTIEHILLSVTVVSSPESAGQLDDSAGYQLEKALSEYHGVQAVRAAVLYDHTKIEKHPAGCGCWKCVLKGGSR